MERFGPSARSRVNWRSLLYVPANVPRFIAKAGPVGADAVVLDLDDSVPPREKRAARDGLAEAVLRCRVGRTSVLVRVNRRLRDAVRDIETAVAAGCDGLLLPKVTGPEHVALLSEVVDDLELQTDGRRIVFVPMVETAAAVRQMNAIAVASERNVGMIIGSEDLATECMIPADDELIITIKRQMVLAAAAAGISPFGLLGRSISQYRDLDAVRAAALRSRRSGFVGATCIHPSVVPVFNEAFLPEAEELDLANRQIKAAEEAERIGRGTVVVDGRMVDEPIVRRARHLVAASHDFAIRHGES